MSTDLTESEVKLRLREWIRDVNRQREHYTICDTTPLLTNRLVTSLQVIDLILYLEELSGRPVQPEDLKPGAFRDIDSIYTSFFGAEK